MGENFNSIQKKGKAKILGWAYKNFDKLTVDNKIKVWVRVYDKSEPNVTEVRGSEKHPIALQVYIPENKTFDPKK